MKLTIQEAYDEARKNYQATKNRKGRGMSNSLPSRPYTLENDVRKAIAYWLKMGVEKNLVSCNLSIDEPFDSVDWSEIQRCLEVLLLHIQVVDAKKSNSPKRI